MNFWPGTPCAPACVWAESLAGRGQERDSNTHRLLSGTDLSAVGCRSVQWFGFWLGAAP